MVHISILSSEWKKNMSSDFDDGFTFLPADILSFKKIYNSKNCYK